MAKQRVACDICHKRKVQCDYSDKKSTCNWCAHRGESCTIARIRGRRKKKRTAEPRFAVSERIERIENFFADTRDLDGNPNGVTRSSEPPAASTQQNGKPPGASASSANRSALPQPGNPQGSSGRPSPGSIYFNGLYLGTISPKSYAPSLSTEAKECIFSATGEWPTLDGRNSYDPRHHSIEPTFWLQPFRSSCQKRTSLPEIWVVKKLLDEYMSTEFCKSFPIVNRALFEETINTAYEPRSDHLRPGALSARACVFAFLADARTHLPRSEVGSYIDVAGCASEAQALLPDLIEDASITTLQTIMMLLLYHTLSGRIPTAAAFHGLACYVVFALGAHTLDLPTFSGTLSIDETRDVHLRKLFWLMYVFDKELALRTGQPPQLCDEYCNLSEPPEDLKSPTEVEAPGNLEPLFSEVLVPGGWRLSIIKSKIFRLLYSFEAFRKPETELLRSIRELDEELESWRQSISKSVRPDLSTSHTKALFILGRDKVTIHDMMHHLQYQHLVGIIHSASGRCTKNPNVASELEVIGIQSSLELSVQASRASLAITNAAVNNFPAEAFWVVVFYPVSAFLTLAFNIFRAPLNSEAEKDTELLLSTANLIKEMSGRRIWTGHEAGCLEGLYSFMEELCRLGRRAVEKATTEFAEARIHPEPGMPTP